MVEHDVGSIIAERYQLDRLIGEGGMGRVFEAHHVLMHKRLAVKLLHDDLAIVPEVLARFEREAQAAAKIEHPNVATASDFGRLPDGTVYLVLEYIDGRGLREALDAERFSVERTVEVTRQLAAGLNAAHAAGIVHRDLKPENVMLVPRPQAPELVKILDFGVAKVPVEEASSLAPGVGRAITKVGMVFGTPEYMAPEQAMGESVDQRADLYALGVMLYEMLTGKRPFETASHVNLLAQQLSSSVPPLRERAPDVVVPAALEQLVLRLLERDPVARPESAQAVLTELEALSPERRGSHHDGARDATRTSLPSASAVAITQLEGSSGRREPWGARALGAAPLRQLLSRFEQELEPWRARLPAPLAKIPAGAFVLAVPVFAGVLLSVLVLIVIVVVRSPTPSTSPSASATLAAAPSASAAPRTGVVSAERSGSRVLEEELRQSPQDARLHLALAVALDDEERYPEAFRSLERALELEPQLQTDVVLGRLVEQAVRREATREQAFTLMQGHLGQAGADMIYTLSRGKEVPSLKARADKWLRSAEGKKSASPALLIALELAWAPTCTAKKQLLARAKAEGDARSLPHLRNLQLTTGCGWRRRSDCFPCLRGSRELPEAIEAISARQP